MNLKLVKPNEKYFNQYNEMMVEWIESKSHIAPWFLDKPIATEKDFKEYCDSLVELEEKTNNSSYPTQSLYFVVDENDKLIGAGRLAHYLVDEYTDNDGNSFNVWGHTGYGVRPSERKKGYGTEIEKLLLQEAKKRNIDKVYVGIHDSNIGSIKVIENCNGIFEKIIKIDSDPEKIRKYYINN